MSKNFGILGGDKRIVELSKMLAKDNWMFKLSYKSHLKVSINGCMTYYGTMISGNL